MKDLKQTGAIAPSSKFLAKDLVSQLKQHVSCEHCPPLNILEIGPGTGPMTKQIVKYLRAKDTFDVVEIHEKFYEIVDQKFQRPNIQVYHEDILKFDPLYKYDFIFSSLPYENMPPAVCRRIWEKKLALCADDAFISYFKYVKFRDFKNDFEEKVVKKYEKNKKFVFLNIPPAKVYNLEIHNAKRPQEMSVDSANVA